MFTSDLKLVKGIGNSLYKKKGLMYSKIDLDILFPVRYEDANLANLSGDISYLGVCILLVNNGYLPLLLPTMLISNPFGIKVVKIDDEEYYRLTIKADEPMFKTSVVKSPEYVYHVTTEFIIKGKVPFFITRDDMVKVFNNLKKFTGSDVFDTSLKSEVFVAATARTKDDPTKFLRHNPKKILRWIGIADRHYGKQSNIARLSGAYLDNNLTVALNTTNVHSSKLEENVLR